MVDHLGLPQLSWEEFLNASSFNTLKKAFLKCVINGALYIQVVKDLASTV